MNIAAPVNPRFLDSLTPDDSTLPGGAQKYLIGGLSWYGDAGAAADSLWRLADGASMRRVKPGVVNYEWVASINIGGNVWMDVTGDAGAIEDACAQAMACTGAPIIELHHGGVKTRWHQFKALEWMACLDGDAAHIFLHSGQFFWSRKWALGDNLLAMVNVARQFEGVAPSLEKAMRAAIDAPEYFILACDRLNRLRR